MTDGSYRQITVPELLEAREKIRALLTETVFAKRSEFASKNKADLKVLLEGIESALAEQGYKEPENRDG